VAQFQDRQVEQLGLKQLFENTIVSNAVTRSVLAGNALAQFAEAETNLHLALRTGAHLGICSGEVTSNLLSNFSRSAGVDLLTVPIATLSGANPAQISVLDNLNLLLPSASTGMPRITQFAVGQVFDLRLLGMENGAPILEFSGSFQQFKGYDGPAGSRKSGRVPRFDLAVLAASCRLAPGQSLLLGSRVDTQIQQLVGSVPFFSQIPYVGRFFTKTRFQTNYLRQVVIVRQVPSEPKGMSAQSANSPAK
jgi:Flp pilus assembly secretin CpaC